ncbi:MAG: adenylate/guanylate cyclase domain-containing protein [Alphaproteobacteria bacterium]
MATTEIDPAPRSYPPFVTLLRRGARGPAAAPAATTVEDIATWLLGDALAEPDLLPLYESLVWRLVAAGLPLARASLHVGTLHPQLLGFAWNWQIDDRLCDEVKVDAASRLTDSFRSNPLSRVIERGETIDIDLADPLQRARFPLMTELAARGISHYLALPLTAGGSYHNAATVATRRPEGFDAGELAAIRRVLAPFALHVERHIAQRIAANVLDTYLGSAAGAQVLHGAITRGSGRAIRAIIWVSDLRGFTDLSDRLPAEAMLGLLNAYFERMAGAVMAHGGDVLKFIGDGMLAVFPFADDAAGATAARAALAAATRALADVGALSEAPPPALAGAAGWQPLRSGIALHEGEVFFGNVGAPERLDFTVIGPGVNAAARVEALCKTLGQPVLLTAPVAGRLADAALDDLGEHRLRGLSRPLRLFAPRPTEA